MYWTALLLGITGSLHCAGMCSPLANAVTTGRPFWNKLLYNSGRIVTYGILGALAATLGHLTFLASYQSVLSILLGILIILIGLGFISGVSLPGISKLMILISGWLKKAFGLGIQKKSTLTIFLMGMVNGLLPCGISALALMYCFILPNAQSGFLSMIVFGLGTWPMMLLFPMLLKKTSGLFQFNFKKVTLVALAISGMLMIGHGIWGQHSVVSSDIKSGPKVMAICP